MPNHVINEITLHGVPLAAVAPKVSSEDQSVDFSVLLPLPLNFWPGSVSLKHEKAFPGTHLDAARDTWGTKWNAYGLDAESITEKDGSTVLVFQTAWDHPRGWTVALFNTYRCDITAKWLSEGGWAGHIETYNYAALSGFSGDAWTDAEIDEGSDVHRHLHKLLWGVEKFEDATA